MLFDLWSMWSKPNSTSEVFGVYKLYFRESFDVVFHLGFKMASRQRDTTEEALDAIFQYFFYMKRILCFLIYSISICQTSCR